MRRDMELVRKILKKTEAADEPLQSPIEVDGYDQNVIDYHIVLLQEADFLNASWYEHLDGTPQVALVKKLTWQGHEFLDAARNESVWKKARQVTKDKGVDIPFNIFQSLLETILRSIVMSSV